MTLGALTFGEELIRPFLTCRGVVVVHHVAQVLDDTVERDEIVAGGMHQFLVDAHTL